MQNARIAAIILLLFMTGCAIRKPVQAMYCEKTVRTVRIEWRSFVTNERGHGEKCISEADTVKELVRLNREQPETEHWVSTCETHCAVWAKHPYPCTYDDQTGGCTEATK